MKHLSQSPRDPAFVQDPYPFYARARTAGPLIWWEDYAMPCAFDAATVQAVLRDRRFGREMPAELRTPVPDHLRAFDRVEQHSMLELEPPRHSQLRGLVLRAFTSRRVRALAPDITASTQDLIAALPRDTAFDLIPAFCAELPVRVIARLLGVPEAMAPRLLAWSNAMVAMYQASRTRATEEAANTAAAEFHSYLHDHIAARRDTPADDLISHLIAARVDGERLSTDALIGTCVLLLNAGHEATVHSLGNAVACLLQHRTPHSALAPDTIAATCEELLRFAPPLHMFDRIAYEDITLHGHRFTRGDRIGLMLAAAGRDPAVWEAPDRFDPTRALTPHAAFGGGIHFCVGAPLARLEMQIALPALFAALPGMALCDTPTFADSYHFHKLDRLMVRA
ncbi:cytochrome P450 [Sulfitobacter albidus]|uniref:Cytochrome P450 n=1 Tax=Sulfitobacter albidus TaxID=2829501 RepID=A0A975PNM2_9RHOB|nr:cytochrome P450 [Sulfitobacter albidus]QUJ77465.1 cytochrome P450 [Sulfitobacter albidus]